MSLQRAWGLPALSQLLNNRGRSESADRAHGTRPTAEAALGCFDHVVGPDALLLEIARSALVDGKAANQVFGAEIEPDILELDAQRPNVLCMVEDCLHHRIADLRIEVRDQKSTRLNSSH